MRSVVDRNVVLRRIPLLHLRIALRRFEGKYCNIIILCDHRLVCGPSLTETSFCGAYLYCIFASLYGVSEENTPSVFKVAKFGSGKC